MPYERLEVQNRNHAETEVTKTSAAYDLKNEKEQATVKWTVAGWDGQVHSEH